MRLERHIPPYRWCMAAGLMCGKTPQAMVVGRRFSGIYGATPQLCSRIWFTASLTLPPTTTPKHLLWALLFLKQYSNEHSMAKDCQCDEKTMRKWVWIVIECISKLPLVSTVQEYDRSSSLAGTTTND